ncbi:hypothetical protein OHR68_12575 [Spirillospora sp. NBC_00431]
MRRPAAGLQIVAATSAVSSEQTRNLFAFCPSDTNMLGLGVQVNNGSGQVHITAEAKPGLFAATNAILSIWWSIVSSSTPR